jgi:hypothetical protein
MQKILCTLLFACLLNGCGGGIDEIQKPQLQVDSMLANWTNTDPVCIALGSQSSYKEVSIELWWQDLKKIYTLYDNATCSTTYVARIMDTYQADWSSPISELTRSGAARIKLSAPKRQTESNLPNTVMPLDLGPILALVSAENNQLNFYINAAPIEQDAEGYPLGISPAAATYTK